MNKKRRLRRLWYIRKRNITYYRILLCVTTVFLFFSLLWCYTLVNLFPQGLNRYEEKLEGEISAIVEDNSARYIKLDNPIEIEKSGGTFLSAKVDNIKLNKLSTSIEKNLDKVLLSEEDEWYTPVKVAAIPFINAEINLGGVKITGVETNYINRFKEFGERDKKLNILIEVTITYEYLLGENSRKYEFNLMDAMLE